MIYWDLFYQFFKVSCFTFGGAYGAIPLIRDMVLRCGWLTEDQISYMIAVSESTPGPIMVNLATYIGSDQAGFWGSLIATVAVVLPAYLVILLVVMLLQNLIKNRYVQAILSGLKPCVVGIVLATGLCMSVRSVLSGPGLDGKALLIAALLTAAMVLFPKLTKKKLSPIGLILLSAAFGILLY